MQTSPADSAHQMSTVETIAAHPVVGPYSLQLLPPGSAGCGQGSWRWAIRKHGKVFQRSDRGYRSEDKAKADGIAMIDRIRAGADAW